MGRDSSPWEVGRLCLQRSAVAVPPPVTTAGRYAGRSRCLVEGPPLSLPALDEPRPPRGDLCVLVTGRCDHRRPAGELTARLDDPAVEVRDGSSYPLLGGLAVERTVELGVLLAQRERRGEHAGDALALDEALDPPVGVVRRAEPLDRLARPGQVVELAALHRTADLQVDPERLLLHPLGGGVVVLVLGPLVYRLIGLGDLPGRSGDPGPPQPAFLLDLTLEVTAGVALGHPAHPRVTSSGPSTVPTCRTGNGRVA